MISKVLIANRGEIALRVIKTCKALGIKTVAVYSDEDRNSLHVKNATESYHIGEAAPAKSYLNQEKILDVILSSGADAVHPGYGFLSENPEFAGLCEKNKVTFIGPSAASMDLCGDKQQCKAAMLKAKVPTVPGSPDVVKDADEAEKIANEIGYPVMLKSVYGGGGITPDEFIPWELTLQKSTQKLIGHSKRPLFNWGTMFVSQNTDSLENYEDFRDSWTIADNQFDKFLQYLTESEIEPDSSEWVTDEEYIKNIIKSEIAGAKWGKDAQWGVRLMTDNQIIESLNYFDQAEKFLVIN